MNADVFPSQRRGRKYENAVLYLCLSGFICGLNFLRHVGDLVLCLTFHRSAARHNYLYLCPNRCGRESFECGNGGAEFGRSGYGSRFAVSYRWSIRTSSLKYSLIEPVRPNRTGEGGKSSRGLGTT